MKPNEIAKLFSDYMEEGTTPKGVKIQSFFSHLTSSQKAAVAKNISRAYASHVEDETKRASIRKEKKKEIAEIKKKAKELGLVVSEA